MAPRRIRTGGVVPCVSMTPEERVVIAELRATIRERTSPRGARQGISLRELDRMIGKEGQGWTSKFLRESDEFPGVPSIGTLLAVLFALRVEPAQFFERARSKGNCCSAIKTGFDLAAAIALSVAK